MTNDITENQSGPETSSAFDKMPGQSAPPAAPTPTFEELRAKVGEDITATREAITDGSNRAVEKIQDAVADQASFAAHQVAGIASALEKVGSELEGNDQPHVGRYAKQIGTGFQSFARDIEGKDLGQIATMSEEFGRRQPLAFLGMAALAGLAASRFITASSKRKPDNDKKTTMGVGQQASPLSTEGVNHG